MSYVTPEFALFFLLFAPTYFVCPGRYRWLLLLVASYAFYIYGNAQYTLVLALLTLATYISARAITQVSQQRTRAILLGIGIGINLGTLLIFKYAGFLAANIPATSQQTQSLTFFLPLGISFYTFQQIAYLIDVYRNRIKPEPHLGIFAVFTSFFPTVSSGPIERAGSLIPQLRSRVTFDEVAAVEGLRLILWGVLKKVVLTNSLAAYVDSVYNSPRSYAGLPLAIATFFYAFQIYGDFSAYSDIAVGIARILGFKLTINFRQPYFSLSVREFWQRWHISLSTWIRDYLFFPFNRLLIGLSKGRASRLIQLTVSLLVMGIVGLWHGASWTFIVWGLIHGLYLTIESFFGVSRSQQTSSIYNRLFRAGLTFALVSFT
jgi:alginate O-acetyltransferase complex protein AlgI